MTTGERIKAEREKRGYSQVDLADAVGTYRQQIFKYETGVIKDIPKATIEKIADVLGVTPSYLCGWDRPCIGRRIRDRREELCMTQGMLAKAVGYTDRSSIAKVEDGKVDLPESKIRAFAKALNLSEEYLLTGRPREQVSLAPVDKGQTYTLYENLNGMRVQLGCKMTLIEVNAAIENHASVHGATQFIIDVEMKNKLGERLRELRTFRGLSQWQVAEILGTFKSSIDMYERGECEPGVQMLMSMAQFYRVTIDYLVGMTDKKEES